MADVKISAKHATNQVSSLLATDILVGVRDPSGTPASITFELSVIAAFLATATIAPAAALTDSAPMTLEQEWNGAGPFTGFKINVTDTASAAASLLADFQVGGVSQVRISKAGSVDIYNAFTDASNYERGFFRWDSNILKLGAEAAGTGTGRAAAIISGDSSGNIYGSGQSGGGVSFSLEAGGNSNATFGFRHTTGGTHGSGTLLGFFGRISSNFGWFDASGSPHLALASSALSSGSVIGINGVTSSYPGLKRSGAVLQARLADDSDFCDFACEDFEANGAVVMMGSLPTSDPTVAGQLWNNSGVVTVSAG